MEGLSEYVPPDFSLGMWSVNCMAVLPVFSICACACSQGEGERADPDLVWVSVLWCVTSMWVRDYHSIYSSQPPSYWELCQRAHRHPVTMTSSSQKREWRDHWSVRLCEHVCGIQVSWCNSCLAHMNSWVWLWSPELNKLSVVVNACNLSTGWGGVEAGVWEVQDSPWLQILGYMNLCLYNK